jgi:hypothetical protein
MERKTVNDDDKNNGTKQNGARVVVVRGSIMWEMMVSNGWIEVAVDVGRKGARMATLQRVEQE